MGRTKNVPKKKEVHALGNCSLSTIGEFIPLYRKKRSKKQSPQEKIVYHQIIPVEEHQKQYYLGEISLGSTSNVIPEDFQPSKISFKSDDKQNFMILNCKDECLIAQMFDHVDINFIRDIVQTKVFSIETYAQNDNVYFKLYLISIPLPRFSSKVEKCIQTAFKLFYNVHILDPVLNKGHSSLSSIELNDLYKKLLEQRESHQYPKIEEVDLQFLRPKLRPYQEKAVQWMIYRETQSNDLTASIHPLYQKITLKSGTDIYLDKYTGWIENELPLVESNWKGGILADEMGLGKTVEVLALILSNRFNKGLGANCDWFFKKNHTDDDSEEQLVIKSQGKKRQLPSDDEEEYVVKKKSKIPETFVKNSAAKKSATFQALQSIYNRTLSEYCTTEARKPPEESQVQCICGSSRERGCVECQDCGKLQHGSCLGWRRQLGPYRCPQCWEKADLIKSRATLIVAPAALRKQWCREMKTHLKPGLKVLNYEGSNATPVYPTELKDYEIVVTTYSDLQAEMRLTETGQSLNLRRQRKYWPPGSPLVRVLWWRLCLDEAQTVETSGSIVSLMARKIPACHRWAVTGTPMSKDVSDIFGLIDYLQMEPYNDFVTWKHILYDPYVRGNKEPMCNFLSKVLWRTTKSSVLDQVNIPHQTQELHLLEFSAVEKFFYNREHEVCARDFLHIAAKFDPDLPLEKMDRSDLKNLMAPVLSLRQACSDPSAVRGKGRYLSLKKNASSMKDLLDALILKNKNDCEESLRLMVCSINGLAGIYLLSEEPDRAIREYRKVLQLAAKFSVEEKEGKLVIDKLPLIHAMHNLAEVLAVHPPEEHTLRDATLIQDCAELEKQYIEKFMKETAVGKEACLAVTSTVKQHEEDFVLKHGQWYSDGFDWVTLNDLDQDLIARVEAAAANANVDCDIRLETARTLLRRAYNWHLDLEESRDVLCAAVDALYREDDETKHIVIVDGLVEKAMDCHLRPQLSKGKKKSAKCPICVANDYLKNYEGKLFTMKKRSEIFEEMGLVGGWKPRLEEILLKALLGLLKSRNSEPDLVKDGETHISLIDALKKEFKEIRKVWTLLDQQVCAKDELDICKVRLQLKTGDDSKDKPSRILRNLSYEQGKKHDNINLIRPSEIPHQELNLKSEETRHNARLEALLGTRNYLGTLRQQQFEGYNPDPCPVCRGPLVNTWAILSCAHTYCMDCFQALLNKANTHIQCCVCRAKQNLQEVAYIKSGTSAGSQDTTSEDDIQVLGNYSRKVEDVVRLLLKLRKSDPQVKVLLFSTWSVVLKLLKNAFEQNDVKVELADASSSFEKRIESFKDPVKKITVLLLPIRLGAKGLNLIEATHVILLEPLLNPADELQAIGRVHRIGQTKPTVVHKFLVRNTIEESLYNATSSNAAQWEKGRLTVGQLKSLFINTCTDSNPELATEETFNQGTSFREEGLLEQRTLTIENPQDENVVKMDDNGDSDSESELLEDTKEVREGTSLGGLADSNRNLELMVQRDGKIKPLVSSEIGSVQDFNKQLQIEKSMGKKGEQDLATKNVLEEHQQSPGPHSKEIINEENVVGFNDGSKILQDQEYLLQYRVQENRIQASDNANFNMKLLSEEKDVMCD